MSENADIQPIVQRGTCACGRPTRPNQRDCYDCHAIAQAAYRARQKNELIDLRRKVHDLTLEKIISDRTQPIDDSSQTC